MRASHCNALLLSLMLAAAQTVHAQQPDAGSAQPQAAPSLPERVLDGIGGAVRGLFQSLFAAQRPREGEIPNAPPPPSPPDAAPAPATASAPAAPVAATPVAVATQTLHSAIAKGEYAAAVKMIEQGTDVEAKDPGA